MPNKIVKTGITVIRNKTYRTYTTTDTHRLPGNVASKYLTDNKIKPYTNRKILKKNNKTNLCWVKLTDGCGTRVVRMCLSLHGEENTLFTSGWSTWKPSLDSSSPDALQSAQQQAETLKQSVRSDLRSVTYESIVCKIIHQGMTNQTDSHLDIAGVFHFTPACCIKVPRERFRRRLLRTLSRYFDGSAQHRIKLITPLFHVTELCENCFVLVRDVLNNSLSR